MLLVPAGLVLLAACGAELPAEGGLVPGEPPASEFSMDHFVGVWEYAVRYPGGDEMAMVRTLTADGKGSQYVAATGPVSNIEFDWKVSDDGKKFEMHQGGMLISRYVIVSCAEGEHVLSNAHDLEETYRRK